MGSGRLDVTRRALAPGETLATHPSERNRQWLIRCSRQAASGFCVIEMQKSFHEGFRSDAKFVQRAWMQGHGSRGAGGGKALHFAFHAGDRAACAEMRRETATGRAPRERQVEIITYVAEDEANCWPAPPPAACTCPMS